MRRLEQVGIVGVIVALIAVPTAYHGWPTSARGNLFTALLLASGLTLVWWRTHPRIVAVVGGALLLLTTLLGSYGWFPDTAFAIMALLSLVAALGWSGRAAWGATAGLTAYLAVVWLILGERNEVPLIMFTVPSFLAGTVLRLRREAADELARRSLELEEERELFAELAVRHERARIAAELHDIVGHAISVMVIQAAAGQRLVERDPVQAEQVFVGIAESARQGHDDLQRLVELLGGTEVSGPDLSLIDEVVSRAARGGLDVSCRFEGDREGLAAPTAHIAFRVVQESLTNALRYAPGAAVRVLVNGSGRGLIVRVDNDHAIREHPRLSGTGHGLIGLRERVQEVGGQLAAGPVPGGGWRVEATLPNGRTRTHRGWPGASRRA
ncbi:signal transduction histidine kinase [Kribbella voronezhensis]|uniref:histidine kinase n=1 Tax=Kribbella voronezhensis TaxID=2512212 RepID=A0A4R7T660_9ACTN|nr:histidine kinase [Kribbella voronezhensis]TDU86736.1 signal transduction histidine kinase [Kribbella voronezhensis]